MQETKGECCEKCACEMLRESDRICHNERCRCHNSSDAFIEEKVRDFIKQKPRRKMTIQDSANELNWIRAALKEAMEKGMEMPRKEDVKRTYYDAKATWDGGKSEGANEFKQKVLGALPKEEPTEQRTERFVNYNHFGAGFNRALSEIRTIISNLEV